MITVVSEDLVPDTTEFKSAATHHFVVGTKCGKGNLPFPHCAKVFPTTLTKWPVDFNVHARGQLKFIVDGRAGLIERIFLALCMVVGVSFLILHYLLLLLLRYYCYKWDDGSVGFEFNNHQDFFFNNNK